MEMKTTIKQDGKVVAVVPCLQMGSDPFQLLHLCVAQWVRDTTGDNTIWDIKGAEKEMVDGLHTLNCPGNIVATLSKL